FGSEIKAILAAPHVHTGIDPLALDQVFTYWSTLSPRTSFRGIVELPPGHYALARNGKVEVKSYWRLRFSTEDDRDSRILTGRRLDDYLDEFRQLMIDATCVRLRADVP